MIRALLFFVWSKIPSKRRPNPEDVEEIRGSECVRHRILLAVRLDRQPELLDAGDLLERACALRPCLQEVGWGIGGSVQREAGETAKRPNFPFRFERDDPIAVRVGNR